MAVVSADRVNHWSQRKCAKAFWGQRELPPYRRLLADTLSWVEVAPGQRWLDLGCGGGQLTRALWEKSGGRLAEVVALDCAAANGDALERLCAEVTPTPRGHLRFLHADFSAGLAAFTGARLDGVVSGLAIHYAESFDSHSGRWTTDAYERLLADVCAALRPGGQFVFSVCVPRANWWTVAFSSILGFFVSGDRVAYLKKAWRMLRYGRWLQQQVRQGRFHYLPADVVSAKLTQAGFQAVEWRLSFAGQAYVFRCRKPSA